MQSTKARKSALQKKLVAAVAMLLVSCIMVVNSTYAWFTLSTAPEITGISTSVGANGNLEMALLDFMPTADQANYDLTKIVTGVGNSLDGKTDATGVKDANATWGNLVTMKDPQGNDAYHLDSIVLKPSRLNLTSTTNGTDSVETLKASMLMTPVYGSDGRVANLSENTATGAWANNGFTVNEGYGVRAVGSASSMTPGELAIRNALGAISSNKRSATELASAAIQQYGGKLGDIAVEHGLASDGTDLYTAEDVAAVKGTVDELAKAVQAVELALRNAAVVMLHGASTTSLDLDANDVTIVIGDKAVIQYGSKNELLKLDAAKPAEAAFDNILQEYKALYDSITNAQLVFTRTEDATADPAVKAPLTIVEGKKDYTWAEISEPLEFLLKTANLQLNDMTLTEIKADDKTTEVKEGMQAFIDKVTANNMTVDLALGAGSGLFADLAEFCENFSTTITLNNIVYNGLSLNNIKATMRTNVTVTGGFYLPTIYDTLKNTKAGDAGTNKADAAITDYYGYIIDLAFRTNATSANLQLQTNGIDRIYTENDNNEIESSTQGGGSYMLFKFDSSLSDTQKTELMKALRVVFFDPTDSTVLGIATLDTANAKTTAAEGTKAFLYLMEYTVDTEGVVTIGTEKADDDLMELQQSTPKALSALVYLDGDIVGNEDVANGKVSMTGTMNLQFSTDAKLTPMDYTPLKDQDGTTTPSEYTITYVPGENASVAADAPTKYTASTAETITLPTPTTTATDVTFDGWYTEANGAGTKITSLKDQTSNLTLYANWVANN